MAEQANINKIPKVSIGMPVYNGEKYIREALDSLLAQTFTDFELIISDNCSTDGTSHICKEYTNKDSRVRYIRQSTNIGPNANFEFVLQEASGEFFMWAAHDDRWNGVFLEKLVTTLINDQKCGLAFSNFIVKNLETGAETLHKVRASDMENRSCNFITRLIYICPSLVYGLYRLSLIRNAKFEKFDFADVYFISELSLRTKIKIVDDYLYIAGTKGERKPYSLSGSKINRMPFLCKQYDLLKQNCTFPLNVLMFSLVCLYMTYNKIRLWKY